MSSSSIAEHAPTLAQYIDMRLRRVMRHLGCKPETKESGVICKNCRLPIDELHGANGELVGYYHTTLEHEVNIDGADVMIPVTFCPDDKGEAEPAL